MRIIIDMQGCQAANANRGIGRYSLGLVSELVKTRGENEVYLVLNNSLPEHIEFIKCYFSKIMPLKNIHVWESLYSNTECANDNKRKIAENMREAYILSLYPDVLLITSLFEGMSDNAVTGIASFTDKIPTAVILYDLIPLIHRDAYLNDEAVENWYLNKISFLKKAELLLAISESSKQEAINCLGFSGSQIVNISTACDNHFKPCVIDDVQRGYLAKTYNIQRSFILYTGGIDYRKDIEGLIRAFALLPFELRKEYQLAIVCSIHPSDVEQLHKLAKAQGLSKGELVTIGFVPENDLVMLYNACDFFVFPFWREGFGLPALEAMACGRAVIGGNLSSILEVIGRSDALFDPYDDTAIAAELKKLITDQSHKIELEQHGLKQAQKFSWTLSANKAWKAIESLFASKKLNDSCYIERNTQPTVKKRLAYLSPLPAVNSGISGYSVELLPELAKYYDIVIINTQQEEITDLWIKNNCDIHDIDWFKENPESYERVLYHFGNSIYHEHMFSLLSDIPGTVVLHDFFIPGIFCNPVGDAGISPHVWSNELLYSHGWVALKERQTALNVVDILYKYPCNLSVLQESLGIITHSEHARRLAEDFYGQGAADNWQSIPLMRVPPADINREKTRECLGLDENDFVVCSFGILGLPKLNHRLLSAWLSSPMAMDPKCKLIFVGENDGGKYGQELLSKIKAHAQDNVHITGWAENKTYKDWLSAADVAVQLRSLSRGETSAAVLDCMNYGLATIVNANGSMAELPENVVLRLDDEFTDAELAESLVALYRDSIKRNELGRSAMEYVHSNNHPAKCAELYFKAIELFHENYLGSSFKLINDFSSQNNPDIINEFPHISTVLAKNFPPTPRKKQLFIDISELIKLDSKSGIQRVVKEQLQQFLLNPPLEYSVEPVYATLDSDGYYYAKEFICELLDISSYWAEDRPIDVWAGDIFLGLDLAPLVIPAQKEYLMDYSRRGLNIYFIVYDLLPVSNPEFFIDGALGTYSNWLEALAVFNGAICISKTVANELSDWISKNEGINNPKFSVDWFHLGANLNVQTGSAKLAKKESELLTHFRLRKTFLMVSTLEPRKSHAQVVSAFEQLWRQGVDINLVIVGKPGWMVESLVDKLRSHPELNQRLFWLEGISDEFLADIYKESDCLISASLGEGFGLPLIEAAQQLPIIARDIPVFRDVLGDNALYFSGLEVDELAIVIQNWLKLEKVNKIPGSGNVVWQTWEQSAKQLLNVLFTANEKLMN